ncbi:MAG: hypothetical protein JKX76_03755 [Colwellia sp.]|nr:hypothetical protein [Colwellia sp.]
MPKIELTKTGKAVSQKTFGTLVCRDKECRRSAVELEYYDVDLRLVGQYIHHNGYRSLEEARLLLKQAVELGKDPFSVVQPKPDVVVSLAEWKKELSELDC